MFLLQYHLVVANRFILGKCSTEWPGFLMIVPVVSNNVQAIGTIETTQTTETTSITWIELSSIRTSGTIVENLKRL